MIRFAGGLAVAAALMLAAVDGPAADGGAPRSPESSAVGCVPATPPRLVRGGVLGVVEPVARGALQWTGGNQAAEAAEIEATPPPPAMSRPAVLAVVGSALVSLGVLLLRRLHGRRQSDEESQ